MCIADFALFRGLLLLTIECQKCSHGQRKCTNDSTIQGYSHVRIPLLEIPHMPVTDTYQLRKGLLPYFPALQLLLKLPMVQNNQHFYHPFLLYIA